MDPQQPKRRADIVPLEIPGSHNVDGPQHPSKVGEFTFIALWVAGGLAGMITSTLIRQAPLLRRVIKQLGFGGASSADDAFVGGTLAGDADSAGTGTPAAAQALPLLADAIVGNTKHAIVKVFGPPRCSAIRVEFPPVEHLTYWNADTWYYPLPRNQRLAMAIAFANDSARGVEFFQAPGL